MDVLNNVFMVHFLYNFLISFVYTSTTKRLIFYYKCDKRVTNQVHIIKQKNQLILFNVLNTVIAVFQTTF